MDGGRKRWWRSTAPTILLIGYSSSSCSLPLTFFQVFSMKISLAESRRQQLPEFLWRQSKLARDGPWWTLMCCSNSPWMENLSPPPPPKLGVLTVVSLQQSALSGITSAAKSLLGEGVAPTLGSLHPKLIYEEVKGQPIDLTWNNSEGNPNSQTSHVTNCGCQWACIMTQLISSPNHPSPPQFHKCWLQEHSLVNILQAKLCFRVSYLGYSTCAHVSQSCDLYSIPVDDNTSDLFKQ